MRAAVLYDIRDIRVADIPRPQAAEDEVLVQVKAVGVCGSDLHSYAEGSTTGPTKIKPYVLGHEFSGLITDDGATDEQLALFRKAGIEVITATVERGDEQNKLT